MPTLILSPRHSDDSIRLRRAALAIGWDVVRLATWRPPDGFEPADPVLYAEPLFCEAVAPGLGLAVIEPPEGFLVNLPRDYTRREVRLMPSGDARALPGPVFLKPPNFKSFPARVYADGSGLPPMPAVDPVLVSEPVEWEGEYRFFVLDRRVRARSPYWLRDRPARDGPDWVDDPGMAAEVDGLVDQILADPGVDLPAAFVLDAGVIRGRGPAIIEANQAPGAGIYGCDPRDILEVLRAATVRAAD